jgi:hypothetical protein
MDNDQAVKLHQDVERFRRAYAEQLARDPDHMVALAMIRRDLDRAIDRHAVHVMELTEPRSHRFYADRLKDARTLVTQPARPEVAA